MFSTVAPEIVSICTPPESHRELVDAALASSSVRAIWCEKPLSTSLDEAEAMVAACRERGAIAKELAAHRQRGRALDAYAQTDEQAGLDPRLS